ncbi:MAG: serine hydrolase [Kiloniellales bacterium]|nr:serine hydrolase [Kiloniellales bacterium]MDJ0970614.1 serine hydrolase [Kiloniellales bacterium]MDJ0982709.1 serine hydrolase [Kiloniellales bacterium]
MVVLGSSNTGGVPKALDDGWEVSSRLQAGLDPDILASIEQSIADDEHRDFHSLIIARHGQLAYEAYFNGYDPLRLHDIRSAGKSFTSTLIGIAIDQGAIPDVDVRMLPYFENFRPHQNLDHRKQSICVRDLLMMMSGLDADDNDPTTPGCENNMLESDDWIRYGLDLPMVEAPGRRWVYAGVNTMLLAGVLEAATQRPVIEFAKDNLFEPLGIETLHWERSPKGTVVGQGFLSLRGRDQLKLGQLYLNGGSWRGRQIVSKRWTRAASECRVEIPNPWPAGYGYQWWWMELTIENKSFNCYFATGNGGNKIYVLPSLDMVIGMASSAYNQPYMHTRSHEILKRILRATT